MDKGVDTRKRRSNGTGALTHLSQRSNRTNHSRDQGSGWPTVSDMPHVTLLHNPRCSTSRSALQELEDAGVETEVVRYLSTPLDEAQLRDLLAQLEDPVTDLVRRDAAFTSLGLTDQDVATADQVVAVLVAHPRLMQRPVLVRDGRAIIGRPKERVGAFLRQDPSG